MIKGLKKSCALMFANQFSLPQQQHRLPESSARVAGTSILTVPGFIIANPMMFCKSQFSLSI